MDPTQPKRIAFEASSRFRVHGIVTRENPAEALEFLHELEAVFASGYRLQFIEARQRRAR